MYTVKFTRLNGRSTVPAKAHSDDAGFDLYASENFLLRAHGFGCVGTGIALELPAGTEAQIRPRSGLAAKNGVTVLNAPGTIDAGYRGEVKVILINHSDMDFPITVGMRIAQMVIAPVYAAELIEVSVLEDSERGQLGFGSTGVK